MRIKLMIIGIKRGVVCCCVSVCVVRSILLQ